MTKKPKTARRARFTGALAQPIVKKNIQPLIMAAMLRGEDPSLVLQAEQARIDDEIAKKIALLFEHYGIDISSASGDVLPRLALALCYDLVDGFKFKDNAVKRGRPAKDWRSFHCFVKDKQREGRTITEACELYRETLSGSKKPATASLENRFHKCEAEARENSVQATDRLIRALMDVRKREPDWMTRLRSPRTEET